jgi:hypothetical protein
MIYISTLLPMLAAIIARPDIGAPSSLVPRQEDWDGEQTGGIFCERRLQPNWADCKLPHLLCYQPHLHKDKLIISCW